MSKEHDVGAALAVAFLRRRGASRRAHVDLYFADGSMISIAGDSPEASRLIPLARDAIRSARS